MAAKEGIIAEKAFPWRCRRHDDGRNGTFDTDAAGGTWKVGVARGGGMEKALMPQMGIRRRKRVREVVVPWQGAVVGMEVAMVLMGGSDTDLRVIKL